MVIDSSAIIAVLLNESDKSYFVDKMVKAEERFLSASTLVEVGIVLLRRSKSPALAKLQKYLISANITVIPTDEEHAELAILAYAKYGKGHHPAKLNFGDCFAYALAKSLDAPLLFKGVDFQKTDVMVA